MKVMEGDGRKKIVKKYHKPDKMYQYKKQPAAQVLNITTETNA